MVEEVDQHVGIAAAGAEVDVRNPDRAIATARDARSLRHGRPLRHEGEDIGGGRVGVEHARQQHRGGQGHEPGERHVAHGAPLQACTIRDRRAGDARRQDMRRRHRHGEAISKQDRRRSHQLGRHAHAIGEVGLADPFADGDNDPPPADHRAEAQRDRDGDLHPERDVARALFQPAAIGLDPVDLGGGEVGAGAFIGDDELASIEDEASAPYMAGVSTRRSARPRVTVARAMSTVGSGPGWRA
ncbi:hypothetical protein WR25_10641 [Diploscapter pachys]|uniref:Uncharacterized protein n=1 Tax=Diploscapter pachys TaxID=2018661 RepID=A0A2A2K305_9BILA|nr:hypothetical protein WR25_10641 [Diploscapter pachys]